jgi:plasmid maintenance system antidote protein VapI
MSKRKKRPTIAETLKRAVEGSGQNLAEIGRAAGIPQPVLWRFMAGERDLTLRTADKLLDYFGLEIRPRGKGK